MKKTLGFPVVLFVGLAIFFAIKTTAPTTEQSAQVFRATTSLVTDSKQESFGSEIDTIISRVDLLIKLLSAKTLEPNDTNSYVVALQRLLNIFGAELSVTGIYDAPTQTVVQNININNSNIFNKATLETIQQSMIVVGSSGQVVSYDITSQSFVNDTRDIGGIDPNKNPQAAIVWYRPGEDVYEVGNIDPTTQTENTASSAQDCNDDNVYYDADGNRICVSSGTGSDGTPYWGPVYTNPYGGSYPAGYVTECGYIPAGSPGCDQGGGTPPGGQPNPGGVEEPDEPPPFNNEETSGHDYVGNPSVSWPTITLLPLFGGTGSTPHTSPVINELLFSDILIENPTNGAQMFVDLDIETINAPMRYALLRQVGGPVSASQFSELLSIFQPEEESTPIFDYFFEKRGVRRLTRFLDTDGGKILGKAIIFNGKIAKDKIMGVGPMTSPPAPPQLIPSLYEIFISQAQDEPTIQDFQDIFQMLLYHNIDTGLDPREEFFNIFGGGQRRDEGIDLGSYHEIQDLIDHVADDPDQKRQYVYDNEYTLLRAEPHTRNEIWIEDNHGTFRKILVDGHLYVDLSERDFPGEPVNEELFDRAVNVIAMRNAGHLAGLIGHMLTAVEFPPDLFLATPVVIDEENQSTSVGDLPDTLADSDIQTTMISERDPSVDALLLNYIAVITKDDIEENTVPDEALALSTPLSFLATAYTDILREQYDYALDDVFAELRDIPISRYSISNPTVPFYVRYLKQGGEPGPADDNYEYLVLSDESYVIEQKNLGRALVNTIFEDSISEYFSSDFREHLEALLERDFAPTDPDNMIAPESFIEKIPEIPVVIPITNTEFYSIYDF